ncbi:hypothetical protein E8E14_007533 [Neopestalotiopsis sp. 37M]|nr:hypothetical protein E8E14_007533 [Neopestalotiopsis sp. 37M]
MDDALREALRQAREQLFSRGQKVSILDGRIEYNDIFFLRDGEASQILEPQLESVIFDHLIFPSDQERREFADRILRQPVLSVILLAILANGSLPMLKTFEDKFLRHGPPCTHSDLDLLFSIAHAREIFGDDALICFSNQPKNDLLTLVEGNFNQKHNARHGLPYVSTEFLGQGAYGRVQKVAIERGHYTKIDRLVSFKNKEVLSLARKDFNPNGPSFASFQIENKIVQMFYITNPPSSISRALCSITIEFDNHPMLAASIFSEPAKSDLAVYLQQERSNDLGLNERIRNLQQMLHICHGLKWLHHGDKKSLTTGNYEKASYIHGDLKPEKIFIYDDTEGSDASKSSVFKIGDFGETFLLGQSQDEVASLRMSPHFGRVGTYRAPEIQQGRIDTKSDVWSFGCILLLVLLYNHEDGGGPNAVRTFATSRGGATGKFNEDVFYQIKRAKFLMPKQKSVCNQAVTECIKQMISDNKQNTHRYAEIATDILRYIQSRILVHEDSRVSIRDVFEYLGNVMNAMAEMREGQVVPRATYRLEFPDSSSRSYCEYAPNGRVFHYYPEHITFYDSDGKIHADIKRQMAGNSKLKWSDNLLPSSRACGTNFICVLQKTAPNDPVHLSIRYVDTRKTSTVVRLAEVTCLDAVALSPNEELLAVVCDPEKQNKIRTRVNRLNARVLMYRMSDFQFLNPPAKTYTGSSEDNHTSNTSVPLIEPQRNQIRHGEVEKTLPGGHVDLVFSKDGTTLYHAHRGNHHVVVSMWNDDGAFLANTIVEDRLVNDHRIFMNRIVPLFNARGFVAITHERYIIKRQWVTASRWSEKTFQAMQGLKTILVAEDNLRIVMLATNERNFLELHVGSLGDDFRPQRLSTEGQTRFFPSQDSAYLSEHADGRLELQVASKQERCIFKFHFNIEQPVHNDIYKDTQSLISDEQAQQSTQNEIEVLSLNESSQVLSRDTKSSFLSENSSKLFDHETMLSSRSEKPSQSWDHAARGSFISNEHKNALGYDIRSLASNTTETASQASSPGENRRMAARKEFAKFFVDESEFKSMCEAALTQMNHQRLVRNLSRLLKKFHTNLVQEARTKAEKATAELLYSKRGRDLMSYDIVQQVVADDNREAEDDSRATVSAEVEEQSTEVEKQDIEEWLQATEIEEIPVAEEDTHSALENANPNLSSRDFLFGNLGNDLDLRYPHINSTKTYLRGTRAFRDLQQDFLFFLIPEAVGDILKVIPRERIWFSEEQDSSVENLAKVWMEDITQVKWIWWPLSPRKILLRKE